jgi:hypothetical protein
MNDLNPTSSSPTAQPSSELTELKELCVQLRAQTHNLRLAQLIVALAVAGFFWVEVRRNGQALSTMRPQAMQVEEVSKKQTPAINDFVNRLAEFGRTHPDFVPVLTKYGIPTATTSAAPGVPPAATKK